MGKIITFFILNNIFVNMMWCRVVAPTEFVLKTTTPLIGLSGAGLFIMIIWWIVKNWSIDN
jgi:hypothetical protein